MAARPEPAQAGGRVGPVPARVGIALALLIAAPAWAQEVDPKDIDIIESCVAEHREGGQLAMEKHCIGLVARPCAQTPEGQTTLGMNECFFRETAAWDVLLNWVWPQMRARARRLDDANQIAELDLPSADETLLASQRAWLAWREAECVAKGAEWGPGSFGSNVRAFCWHELTARRTVEFLDRVDDEGL